MATDNQALTNSFPSPKIDEFRTEDLQWMRKALLEAKKAHEKAEVPVGAIVVFNNQIISQAHNLKEALCNCLGHAEILALHRAQTKLERWRLNDCELYSTMEPCIMCAGAIQQARIRRLVFGASDPKAGGVVSLYGLLSDPRLNHQCRVVPHVLEKECRELLQNFFQKRRKENRKERPLKTS
ncbi:MAG: tRNA adenosine(34) deaminase TadA [Bdellovibrio sp.]